MQHFGKRLGQTIGQRFDQDRVVIVLFGFETGGQLIATDAGSDGKRADVVRGIFFAEALRFELASNCFGSLEFATGATKSASE